VVGLIDWLAIPAGTRAKRIGALHGVGNVVVVALFAVSWLLRRGHADYRPTSLALWLGIVAVLLALGTAWAGGELVERLGVGVDEGANLDAPSSLSARAAPAGRTQPPSPGNPTTTSSKAHRRAAGERVWGRRSLHGLNARG
jgi:Predicted membrane protein (DUF2231)